MGRGTQPVRQLCYSRQVSEPNLMLHHWPQLLDCSVQTLTGGLINSTWQVGEPPLAVLQRLHSIFAPEVNEDIAAVTAHLKRRGMPTPTVLSTAGGNLSALDAENRCWRALSWVPGCSYDTLQSTSMASQAGELVARWHQATADLDHDFIFRRPAGHNTPVHMAKLQKAISECTDHRLWDSVCTLAESIFSAWERWEGSLDQRLRLCHGDLKISNLRFTEQGEGLCLLDLDTLSMLPLDAELGDAWRSWCNPAGEDHEAARFDLELFGASASGYLSTSSPSAEEVEALPGGIERICLELSSRFASDALYEDYFGWSDEVAPSHGEHSLLRARGQFELARSVRDQRAAIEAILR